ncbi:hypothetical protein CSC82_03805 [Rhodobacteraceae bacterium 4F10]|nr:hypothetical protein CSC82_03805 [Rhodobacteraceae bacterium 4F10]
MAPRFQGASPLVASGDPVRRLCDAVDAMDNTVLPVQGPPSTGKTYVTARAIMLLVRNGKRIGVASNSQEAIKNVLMGGVEALEESDLDGDGVEIAYKGKVGDEHFPEA